GGTATACPSAVRSRALKRCCRHRIRQRAIEQVRTDDRFPSRSWRSSTRVRHVIEGDNPHGGPLSPWSKWQDRKLLFVNASVDRRTTASGWPSRLSCKRVGLFRPRSSRPPVRIFAPIPCDVVWSNESNADEYSVFASSCETCLLAQMTAKMSFPPITQMW